jgi:transcriptional regulator
VVHATGKLNPVTDKKALHDLLARLAGKLEDRAKSKYDFAKLPDADTYGRMDRLIGFEMEIELLEGKFKLGQQASAADQQDLLRNLQSASPGRSMYQFTADFYKRSKASTE